MATFRIPEFQNTETKQPAISPKD